MSDKRSQVLILDPPVDLVFKGPFNEVVTSTLTLTNPSTNAVIFKVKTTAPKQYCVRPNSGMLAGRESAVISVMLQPFDPLSPEKNKHKFMVQTMIAPRGFSLENLDSVWREAPKKELMDSKLRCVFVDSAGNIQDPTSSAISLTPNEGAPSGQALPEEVFKSSVTTTTPAAPTAAATTPKQAEVVTHSTAGSTPAHVGGSNITNKEVEKATEEARVRMMQDKIDQLNSENTQLKSESNKLRQRMGSSVSTQSTFKRKAGSLSIIAIIFILVAIVLGYLVGNFY